MTDPQVQRSEASGNLSPANNDIWRKEIHARVSGYRTRRGRRIEGAFSMRFPFPPLESEVAGSATHPSAESTIGEPPVEAGTAAAVEISPTEPAVAAVCDLEPELAAMEAEISPKGGPTLPEVPDGLGPPAVPELSLDPGSPPAPLPRPKPQRKVIAFPRQAHVAQETVHRLADPVLPEQPRILDVPEELEALPTTPFLDGLRFGPNVQPAATAHVDTVELPFRAAERAQRLYAALLDGAFVAAGTVIFAAVGHQMLPKLVFTKPVLLTAAALPVLLWAAYQYLLVVYSGATPGMRVARIRLSTFRGKPPARRDRRHRVLALYFSTASFFMGLLWALVDVDALCWHDRISRTYLTDRK
jgi:uncharacterized RDD family membrane protein YckC